MIGVTQFFRDTEAYKILKEEVIPKLFFDVSPGEPVRIWSAGCSTGEEAYSIAILCKDYLDKNSLNIDLKIFASDLDKEAIRRASIGLYPESIVADVSAEYLEKYFTKISSGYQVREFIRQIVIFSNHNIITDPPFSKISLVTCRNMLIYFKPEIQNKIINFFQYSLSRGGYLFLGSSEALSEVSSAFEVISSKNKIFKFKEGHENAFLRNLLPTKNGLTSRNRSVTLSPQIIPTLDTRKNNPLIELYQESLNYFAPSGVIIDRHDTIVYFFKDIKRFLNFPVGKSNLNIMELADAQLTMIISNMIYKVRHEKKEIRLNKLKFKEYGRYIELNLAANIVFVGRIKEEFIILTINESIDIPKSNETQIDDAVNYDEQVADRLREMEREIKFRDENLQTTIEELETSNEELQSTNEELVSSNEELQSTNEELQSVNEELYTVNSQFQDKINELTELNDDINNLITNTKIGAIYLDKKLQIRKYTKEMEKSLNILNMDIGRPFSHITLNFNYPKFYEEIQKVQRTLKEKIIEIYTNSGEWYVMKIIPYRHSDNSIHGIVIVQINVTELNEALDVNKKILLAMEQSTNGVMITDINGEIEYVNSHFSVLTGYSKEECVGRKPSILRSGKYSEKFYQNLWNTILSGKPWISEMCNRKKNGDLYWEINQITPILDNKGNIINFLSVREDVTEKRKLNEKLSINITMLENSQKIGNIGSWTFDLKANKLVWSEEVFRILGLKPNEFEPTYEKFMEFVHPEDREKLDKSFQATIRNRIPYQITHRIIRPDGEIRYVEEKSEEALDENNEVKLSIGCIKDVTELRKALESEKKLNEELALKNEEIIKSNNQLNNTNSQLLMALPFPFSYCKVIVDTNNNPIDYEFMEVNDVFEKHVGIFRKDLIGKLVTQVNPKIPRELIERLGKVGLSGAEISFEQYSPLMQKKYSYKVFSPALGYFCELLIEINNEDK